MYARQADLDRIELVDLDQLDADGSGQISPEASGLAAELRREWEASVEAEVAARLETRRQDMRHEMQVQSLAHVHAMPCEYPAALAARVMFGLRPGLGTTRALSPACFIW